MAFFAYFQKICKERGFSEPENTGNEPLPGIKERE
jgi:hypothetical protein